MDWKMKVPYKGTEERMDWKMKVPYKGAEEWMDWKMKVPYKRWKATFWSHNNCIPKALRTNMDIYTSPDSTPLCMISCLASSLATKKTPSYCVFIHI